MEASALGESPTWYFIPGPAVSHYQPEWRRQLSPSLSPHSGSATFVSLLPFPSPPQWGCGLGWGQTSGAMPGAWNSPIPEWRSLLFIPKLNHFCLLSFPSLFRFFCARWKKEGGREEAFFPPLGKKRVESGSQASQGYTYIYADAAAMLSLLCPPAGRRRMDERREFLGEDGGGGGGGGAKKF